LLKKINKYTQYTDTPNYAYKETHTHCHTDIYTLKNTCTHAQHTNTKKREPRTKQRNKDEHIRAFIYKHTYTQTQIHTETHTHT